MSNLFPPNWCENQDRLQVALRRSGGTHAAGDILYILRSNDNAYWLATPDSFVLSEVIDYPRKRIINWSLAGGRMEDMLQFEKTMIAFAQRAGCVECQVVGRAGWERALPGYSKTGSVLRKSIVGV